MKKAVIMTAVGMMLVALAGCGGSNTSEGLLGTWEAKLELTNPETNQKQSLGTMVMVFMPESQLSTTIKLVGVDSASQSTTGTYQVEGNKLTLTIDGDAQSMTFKLSGDTLTLKDPKKGEELVFKRK